LSFIILLLILINLVLLEKFYTYKKKFFDIEENFITFKNAIVRNEGKYFESLLFKELEEASKFNEKIVKNLGVDKISKKIIQDYILPENKVIFEKVEHKEFLKNKIGAISKAWKPYQDLKINDIIAYDIYSVNYYDIKHFSFETSDINNKNLFIYITGHGTGVTNYSNSLLNRDVKKFLASISNEYDLLLLSMTNHGFNHMREFKTLNYPVNERKLIDLNLYGRDDYYDLDYFEYYEDNNNLNTSLEFMDGISLILSGNFYLIKNKLKKKKYDKIVLIGHSGGGVYSLIFPAIIQNINLSISYESPPPILLRQGNWGLYSSFENIKSKLFSEYDYFTFYKLGILNNENRNFNKKVIIYNQSRTYTDYLKKKFRQMILEKNNLNLKYIETKRTDHDIDFKTIQELLKEIK
jgi:hypothetical protein